MDGVPLDGVAFVGVLVGVCVDFVGVGVFCGVARVVRVGVIACFLVGDDNVSSCVCLVGVS